MNWTDDPEIQRELARSRARRSLVRSAIIWTPFFLLFAFGFLYFLVDELLGGNRGSWVLVVILGVMTFLFGFQALQPLQDLRSDPTELLGHVSRRWSRSDSFVVRSHYIRIDGNQIFRVDRDIHGDVSEGDHLRILHYPHSATIIELSKIPVVPDAEPPAEQSDAEPPREEPLDV